MVPHYQPCLLVWCLTLGRVSWCGASLSAVHVGPMALQRTFVTSRVQMKEVWLQGLCYFCRGAITSDMSADPVPLSDMLDCTVQLYQTCMLDSFIQTRMFVQCCSIMQGVWFVTNPSDMPICNVPLPRVCKICPATILEYIDC